MNERNGAVWSALTLTMVVLFAMVSPGSAAATPHRLSLSGGPSVINNAEVGIVRVAASARVRSWLDLSLHGTAVHTLERNYADTNGDTWQIETAWAGLGFRPFVRLADAVEIGLPWRSASGVMQFRYERPYRDELRWTDEILDQETIVVNSLGVDLAVAVGGAWHLTAEGGYRLGSPVRTSAEVGGNVDEAALTGWYATLGASYQIGSQM